MRTLYIITIVGIFLCLALLKPDAGYHPGNNVAVVVKEAAVPNAVTGIILRNRLYDTLFEVMVFAVAVLGVSHYLSSQEGPLEIRHISDDTLIILARVGSLIAALVALELSIRGHLGPGGGFAAGVAGGTGVGLVAVTSEHFQLGERYTKWRVSLLEKLSVLFILTLSIMTLLGVKWPQGPYGTVLSGGAIPFLNFLIALKVAIGSWTILLMFIRYRGLL